MDIEKLAHMASLFEKKAQGFAPDESKFRVMIPSGGHSSFKNLPAGQAINLVSKLNNVAGDVNATYEVFTTKPDRLNITTTKEDFTLFLNLSKERSLELADKLNAAMGGVSVFTAAPMYK